MHIFLFFKFEFLMKWEMAVILWSAPVLSTRRTQLCDTLQFQVTTIIRYHAILCLVLMYNIHEIETIWDM